MSDGNLKVRYRPKQVAALEGCGLTTVFDRVRNGEYDAIRDGNLTLITEESIERRRANLRPASYMPPGQPGPQIQKKKTA